jgi:DNA-binding transcriptional MerR regulator
MMTGKDDDAAAIREDSFLDELIPQVAEHLAEQCAGDFDAEDGRARFRTWLTAHTKEPAALAMAGTRGPGNSRDPQAALFEADEAPRIPPAANEAGAGPAEIGYRGPTACAAAGITYRQLDYWARTGLVEPSVRTARGSGSQRLYSFRDIMVLKVIKRLLNTGISLQQIRAAVQHLRERGIDDLAQVTLMSDGVSVYECTSADEVVDLLQGGQGVFGIALGRVWREVQDDLAVLPAVRAEDGVIVGPVSPVSGASQDDLANRRLRCGS